MVALGGQYPQKDPPVGGQYQHQVPSLISDQQQIAVGRQHQEPTPKQEPPTRKRKIAVCGMLESDKRNVDELVHFVPVLDFISSNPLVEKVIWDPYLTKDCRLAIGNVVSVSDEDDPAKEKNDPAIENSDTGYWVAEGFVAEICDAHEHGLSWAGNFEEKHMFASTLGKFVKIAKIPTEKASVWNRLLDIRNLASRLFSRYRLGSGIRQPPYLKDFNNRVKKMLKEQNEQEGLSHNLEETNQMDDETKLSFWMIKNHPFFVRPLKIKGLFDSFYSSYKSIDTAVRDEEISKRQKNTCNNWHIERVRKSSFLYMVYWSKSKRTPPNDYYTRSSEYRPKDNSYSIFPYTHEDEYLALYIRICYVHGPDIVHVSLDLFFTFVVSLL